MRGGLTFISLLLAIQLFAKENPKYPVSEIPDVLKVNANVVVREDRTRFKIFEKNRATHYVHYVVTILNEKGNDYASQDVWYDRLTKVLDLNATVYDAQGNVIRKLKSKEIYDHASYDGFTLFSDDRIKSMDLSQSTYPYTVEFEYEIESNYLLSIPSSIFGGERVSFQSASYELSYPVGFPIKYKLLNIKTDPVKTINSGFESLVWTFKNLPPIKQELLGPSYMETIPTLVAVPIEFEYSGYSGKRDTWGNFGKWQTDLNRGRDILPESTIALAKELTKNLSTTEEKAKALYLYLQSKTRYVGIQLGIGGLQPFEAKVVDNVGYGDCKALSNYMIALLKAVDIKGYYTLIYGGPNSRDLIEDITYDIFNHIVVSIPNGKDTLWLECTSQTNPFGYQGKFTGDRKALMITEDGGKIVNTIKYTPDQNSQFRTAEVKVGEQGHAKAKIKTTYSGIQYENGGLNEALNSSEELKHWIEKNTEIPSFSINSYSIRDKRDKIPSAILNLDLKLERYASVSGKRVFIPVNLMNKNSFVPPKMEQRNADVILKSSFIDIDTINYSIPENLYPEFLPEPVKINSKFGEYEATFKFDAGKVTYTRRMKVWKGRFPKETYSELVDFYKNVNKADNIKLVFLNKT